MSLVLRQLIKKSCFIVGVKNVKNVPTTFLHQMLVRKVAQNVSLTSWLLWYYNYARFFKYY